MEYNLCGKPLPYTGNLVNKKKKLQPARSLITVNSGSVWVIENLESHEILQIRFPGLENQGILFSEGCEKSLLRTVE